MIKPGTVFLRNTTLWFVLAHVNEHEFYIVQLRIDLAPEPKLVRYYDAVYFKNYCEEICKV